MSEEPRWPTSWVRALLPVAILDSLEGTRLHGYAIAQALGDRGFGVPKGGSLYPALVKLEDAGDVKAEWVPGPSGPARREYTITKPGRRRLAQERALLGELADVLMGETAARGARGAGK